MIKFTLTNPKLIYRSKILANGEINTVIFPTLGNEYYDEIKPLPVYSGSKTITAEYVKRLIKRIDNSERVTGLNKKKLLEKLEDLRQKHCITNLALCDMLAEEIYLPKIQPKKGQIPTTIKALFTDLSD